MRVLFTVLSIGLVAVLAIAFADLQAPRLTGVGVGSVGFEPEARGLAIMPPEDGCTDPARSPDDKPCARRYVFAPNGVLKSWVSVRNDGPLSVTLDGVRDGWVEQLEESAMLARPVIVSDAGNPLGAAARNEVELQKVLLEPGDQRVIGVEFRTTSDVKDACERWMVGSGVVFSSVPVAWHLLSRAHTTEIDFAAPVEFMAPTEADCST